MLRRKTLLLGVLVAVGIGLSGEAVVSGDKRSIASFELLPSQKAPATSQSSAPPKPPTQTHFPQVSERQQSYLAGLGLAMLVGVGMVTRQGGRHARA
ncbi:hypothetical protein [Lacticaseibacillus sp. GG6-2]